MPLNILHHKSWNVYNTENIERVRRDEEKAKEEERKKKEKAIQAEREFRLSLLRQKNSISTDSKSNKLILDNNLNEKGHINLFYEEEQQINSGKNKEREEEEKKQKEKFESQFIYSLTGKDKEKPWYSLEKGNNVNNKNIDEDSNQKRLKQLKKDKKRKEVEDPLELIKKNLEKNKEIELKYKESLPYYQYQTKQLDAPINHSETFTNPTELLKEFSRKRKSRHDSEISSSDSSDSSSESDSSETSNSSSSSNNKRRKHSKRHRHHHSHHHKHGHGHGHKHSKKEHSKKKNRHAKDNNESSKSTIEKLREERLKREQEERRRTLGINGSQQSSSANLVEKDKYFYNSQFNPDSIRQLKNQ